MINFGKVKSGLSIVLRTSLCSSLFFAAAAQANTEEKTEEKTGEKVKVFGYVKAVSAYVTKGATNNPENDNTTLQVLLAASYNGFYTGWWASKLDTAPKTLQTGEPASGPEYYENLFFLGYANKYKDLNYDVNLTSFYYPGSIDSRALQTRLRLAYPVNKKVGNTVGLYMESMLYDVAFANQGDTYVELIYTHPLPQKFMLELSTGLNYFADDGKSKYRPVDVTPKNFVYRQTSVQLSHKVTDNINASVKYIFGGKNRSGIEQKNMPVFAVQFNF